MRFFSKSAVRNRFFLLYLIFALVLFAMYIPLHLHTYSIIQKTYARASSGTWSAASKRWNPPSAR